MQNKKTKEFWIWLAGFVDGEGCIGIYKETDNRRNTWTLRPSFQITNTDKGVIDYIVENIGGTYCSHKRLLPNHKIQYHWMLRDRKRLLESMNNMLPYLIIKKKQAIQMLDYLKERSKLLPARGRYNQYKKEELRIAKKLNLLNFRPALS